MSAGRRAWVWLSGISALALLTVGVFGSAYLIATVPGSRPLSAETWHGALGVLAAIGDPGLRDFSAVAGVVATFLVAAAAATAFGANERLLTAVTGHALFACLVVGALLLSFLAVLSVPVAVIDHTRIPSVVVVLVLAWMALLITHAVESVSDESELRRHRDAAVDRAAAFGIRPAAGAMPAMPGPSTVLQFVAPFLVWLVVVLFVFGVGRFFDEAWWRGVVGVAVAAYYPNLLLSLIWRATADLTRRAESIAVVRSIGLVLVAAGTAALVSAFSGVAALQVLAWALAGFTLVHAVVLFVRTVPRFPLLDRIEERVTQRSLASARISRQSVAPPQPV